MHEKLICFKTILCNFQKFLSQVFTFNWSKVARKLRILFKQKQSCFFQLM